MIKNQAVDLTDMAIGIIILGIVVSIGASIIITFRDSRLTDLSTVTTSNETITQSSTTKLSNSWGQSVTTVTNATGGNIVGSGNYTTSISSVDGYITIDNTTSTFPGQWNVTYNWYNTSRSDWAVANDSAIGLGEYGNWFKIIVIVGVASLVLALIFMSFGRSSGVSDVGY